MEFVLVRNAVGGAGGRPAAGRIWTMNEEILQDLLEGVRAASTASTAAP